MVIEAILMAKPKRKAAPKPMSGIKTIGIRATTEWVEWLEELARAHRTTVSGIIDRALAEWTEAKGYTKRPPERTQ
jgi:hypothetical protein